MQPSTEKYKSLLSQARRASESAHAPYSQKPRGAAILTKKGKVITGSSVEFANWSHSLPAVVSAVAGLVSSGETSIVAIALYPPEWPCGQGRQALVEFGIDIDVVVENPNGEPNVVSLRKLLPRHFGPDNLE